jgi:hypothetical protein
MGKPQPGDAAYCMAEGARLRKEKKAILAKWDNEQASGAFCPQCAKRRPKDSNAGTCIPCANAGHSYRLIETDMDRLSRVEMWRKFYDAHGYTEKERGSIPHFQNLITITVGDRHE